MRWLKGLLGSNGLIVLAVFLEQLLMPEGAHACPITGILIAIGTAVGVGGAGVAAGVAGALVVGTVATTIGTSIHSAVNQPKYPSLGPPQDDPDVLRQANQAAIQRRNRANLSPSVLAGESFLEESVSVQRSALGPEPSEPTERT